MLFVAQWKYKHLMHQRTPVSRKYNSCLLNNDVPFLKWRKCYSSIKVSVRYSLRLCPLKRVSEVANACKVAYHCFHLVFFHEWFKIELDLHRIMSGFHGEFVTGMACQKGTLTLPDTWFPSPVLGLACAPIIETRFLELAMSLRDFSHWLSRFRLFC